MDPVRREQRRKARNLRFAKSGKNLAKRRHAAGFTQRQLAPLAGCARSFLADIESGRRGMPRKLGARIALVIGCNVQDIVRES
jgi:DNA-binding XRE family transcriptional regulator